MTKKCEPLISIIIPAYNTGKYIERCIDSICSQTYKNLEIICVNDGSTDETGSILDRLSETDERLVVIHKKKGGVTSARNAALEIANGEYIGFVDSDDYIDKNMYSKLFKAMEKNHADIATCSYYLAFDEYTKRAENLKPVPTEKVNTRVFLQYVFERDTYRGVGGYLWTRLFKRDLIKTKDGELSVRFKEEYLGADDIVFLAEVHVRSETTVYVNEPLYYYYQREGSIVHDRESQYKTLFTVTAYEKLIDFYRVNDVEEEVIEYIIRMYVYLCGIMLEIGLKKQETEKVNLLRKKIKNNLDVYVKTNKEHMDRVKWLVDMLV